MKNPNVHGAYNTVVAKQHVSVYQNIGYIV